jgi:hypothetical protein
MVSGPANGVMILRLAHRITNLEHCVQVAVPVNGRTALHGLG